MIHIFWGGKIEYMGVSKNRGVSPKMDGENNGKTLLKWDDLGVPLFSETPISLSKIYRIIEEPENLPNP